MNFSDPFGDSVQIGWRPLYNPWVSGQYVHFAVRVGGNGSWHAAELLPDDAGPNHDNRNNISIFNGSGEHAREYTWNTVAVPQGQTQAQFDRGTLRSIADRAGEYNGKNYSRDGSVNSNHFVYDVVKSAGGQVPSSAVESARPRTAPGICGGSGRTEGTDCH